MIVFIFSDINYGISLRCVVEHLEVGGLFVFEKKSAFSRNKNKGGTGVRSRPGHVRYTDLPESP